MSYLKFGVHAAGVGGNYTGFGDYVAACRDAGVPCIVQAVDNAGPAFAVQELERPFDVIVFRMTSRDGVDLDHLPYSGDPAAFARLRMANIANYWPPELDRSKVWTVPVNEPSKEPGDIEWLAAFTLECGRIAVETGTRHLAYGWSAGTPERDFWQLPDTLEYLRLCGSYPHLLGVSLHEYGLDDDITDAAPWLIGRFEFLHEVCRTHAIPYPTIIIGEFGWREASLRPSPRSFREQLGWAQGVYDYPNILGAAIWTLGYWHGTVANDLSALMPELIDMATSYDTPPDPPPPPPPDGRHKAIVVKLPQNMTAAEWAKAAGDVYPLRHTMTASHDDTMSLLKAGNAESFVKFYDPRRDAQTIALVEEAGYQWQPLYGTQPPPPPPPPPTGQQVDILPYFTPTADVGQFAVLAWLDGSHTQDQQLQRRSDGTITLVKGNDYERWKFTDDGMVRYEDTSMGGALAYTQNGARWLPQVVNVGATYANSVRVTVKRRGDCSVVADDMTTDYLTVAALHRQWSSPANAALTFANVLEIHWRKTPAGQIQERYFVALGLAYVAWGRDTIEAAVSELPSGRPALPWASWGCG